jgi:hypothetical protein
MGTQGRRRLPGAGRGASVSLTEDGALAIGARTIKFVIARSEATTQSMSQQAALWIASRSLSSGGASRRPGGSQRRSCISTCDKSTRRANHF